MEVAVGGHLPLEVLDVVDELEAEGGGRGGRRDGYELEVGALPGGGEQAYGEGEAGSGGLRTHVAGFGGTAGFSPEGRC